MGYRLIRPIAIFLECNKKYLDNYDKMNNNNNSKYFLVIIII